MPATTSSAAPMQRPTQASAPRQQNVMPPRKSVDDGRALTMGTEEAAVLKLDLSDLALPKVGGLQVDGFKPSFFERLFGKR